jgi:arginine/lysine/ornithine decarboxylase
LRLIPQHLFGGVAGRKNQANDEKSFHCPGVSDGSLFRNSSLELVTRFFKM